MGNWKGELAINLWAGGWRYDIYGERTWREWTGWGEGSRVT